MDHAPSADGYPLAITRFPAEGDAWATMLIAGAMAVHRDFYAPIARFFAANGIHVLTFDYRGMGASRPAKLRGFEASVTDWAQKDMNAMLTAARKPAPHLPLLLLGHSLGGQILGIVPENAQVAAAINVTAGSGYYRFNEVMWWRVRLLWFVTMLSVSPTSDSTSPRSTVRSRSPARSVGASRPSRPRKRHDFASSMCWCI